MVPFLNPISKQSRSDKHGASLARECLPDLGHELLKPIYATSQPEGGALRRGIHLSGQRVPGAEDGC
jgi:hypothetical protein